MDLRFPIDSDLLTWVFALTRELRACLLDSNPITVSQYRVLLCIAQAEGGRQPRKIAQELYLSPSAVSSTLAILESAGYLRRYDDPMNRRVIDVCISDKGLDVLKTVNEVISVKAQEYLKPLGSYLKRKVLDGGIEGLRNLKKLNPSFDDISVNVALVDAHLSMESRIRETLRSHQLSINQFRVIFELFRHPSGVKVGEVAHALLLKMTDMVSIGNALAKQQLITRMRHPYDRRIILYELTSDGYAVLKFTAQAIDEIFCQTVEGSPALEKEMYLKAARVGISHKRDEFRIV